MFGVKKCSFTIPAENAGNALGVLVGSKLSNNISVRWMQDKQQATYICEFYATRKEYDDTIAKLKDKDVMIPVWDSFGRITYRRPF